MSFDQQQTKPQQSRTLGPKEIESITQFLGKCDLNPAQIQVVFDLCPSDLPLVEFKRYLYVCKAHDLNPLLNEIHPEYRYDKQGGTKKLATVVHIDAYRRKGAESGEIDGIKQDFGKDEEGSFVDTFIYKKGHTHPFHARAYRHEFYSDAGFIWKSKPITMTAKCSEALAWRKVGILVGTVSEDEMTNADETNGNGQQQSSGSSTTTPSTPGTENVAGYSIGVTEETGNKEDTNVGSKTQTDKPAATLESNKARSAEICGKLGINSQSMIEYMCGYFDKKDGRSLPKTPSDYDQPFTTLESITPEEKDSLVKNPRSFGEFKAGRVQQPAQFSNGTSKLAAEASKKLGLTSPEAFTAYIKQTGLDKESDDELQEYLRVCCHTNKALLMVGVKRNMNVPFVDQVRTIEARLETTLEESNSEAVEKTLEALVAAPPKGWQLKATV